MASPATDPASLLASANCYNCYGSSGTIGLMMLGLLRLIALNGDPMADTSPEALLEQAKCYRCYQGTEPLLMLALLAQIATNGGGGGSGGGIRAGNGPPVGALPGSPRLAYEDDLTGIIYVQNSDGTWPTVP